MSWFSIAILCCVILTVVNIVSHLLWEWRLPKYKKWTLQYLHVHCNDPEKRYIEDICEADGAPWLLATHAHLTLDRLVKTGHVSVRETPSPKSNGGLFLPGPRKLYTFIRY